jgi:hypothetical protein
MAKKQEIQFNRGPDEIIAARRERREAMAAAKRERAPLGGARPPRIPPLHAQNIDGGGTMEQQANRLQDPRDPMSPNYDPAAAVAAPFAPLPPQAQEDPRFRPGVGSMFQGNQPQLRDPARAGATEGDGYRPHLSDESVESMRALAAFHETAQAHQTKENEQKHRSGPDTSILADENPGVQDELKRLLGSDEVWNKLNNPERRKRIEEKLEPMDLMDIILEGEIRQTIPVREGLSVELRSVGGDEDLEVKRLMATESGSDRYLMDKFTLMSLCLGIVQINGKPLPTHLKNQEFDEEMFLNKFKKLTRFPLQFLADLGVQYMWFDDRVRDLLVGETEHIKNS